MTVNGWVQIVVFLLLVLAVTKPIGVFITRVFNRERTFMDPILRPVERPRNARRNVVVDPGG